MSTVVIGSNWTKLRDAGNDGLLVSSYGSTDVEIGITVADSAPTDGHILSGKFFLTRRDVGNGYVWARVPVASNVDRVELQVTAGGEVPTNLATLTQPVTVSSEVEVKNDSGSPIPVSGPITDTQLRASPVPVSASGRACVGRQTIIGLSTTTPATLTVPNGAVAAMIQADGSAVSITLDGSTNPTATVGSRIDDGVFYYVDTPLANVKLIARSATTNVQVAYFDKV